MHGWGWTESGAQGFLPPLSIPALLCDIDADVGPFLTPSSFFPTLINGVPAQPVCDVPGEQLVRVEHHRHPPDSL